MFKKRRTLRDIVPRRHWPRVVRRMGTRIDFRVHAPSFTPTGRPEGKAFLRTYESMASLWIANMGSATRLQDPKYGSEGRREYLNLVLNAAQKGRTQATDPAALTLIDVETGITYARLGMVEVSRR